MNEQMILAITGCLAAVCILVPLIINITMHRKESLQYRFIAVGITEILAIGLYLLNTTDCIAFSVPWLCTITTLCWMIVFLFISFLIELTATKRPRMFCLYYLIPVALGVFSGLILRPPVFIIFSLFCLSIAVALGLRLLFAWIKAATDDRARRDGEWMTMVFITFGVALVICLLNTLIGTFWLLALWYVVIHIVINHLRIRTQLTDPENILIIDNIFDIVVILDSMGRIIRINRRGLQLVENSPAKIHGNGIENLIVHAELSCELRQKWLEQYSWYDTGEGTGRSPSIDADIITSAGEKIPIDLRIIRLVDLRKITTGYILSATDMRITHQLMKEISDREYAARDLALSESKFSRMFLFNPTGILIVDIDSLMITDANPSMEEILECDRTCLPGKTLADIGLTISEMSIESFIETIGIEGSIPESDAQIHIKSGATRKCRISAVTFDVNNTHRILLSIADITEREALREELGRTQKVETVGILAGGIAHDFNNILAVILGHIGLAKMRVADQHARLPIEQAEEACLRAREMTQQLLVFSRGGKPVIGTCATRSLLMDSAMPAVSDSSVACLFDIDRDIWPLKADKIQIGQLISNLVVNAVDAMGKSGIVEILARNRDLRGLSTYKRPTGLKTKPLPPGLFVEIRIRDQGPGISEAIKSQMFDPFFTTKEHGTGLGLSIVYSIVQNHDGALLVDSVLGEGTTFTIFLPAAPDVTPAIEASLLPPTVLIQKRILLMDDDADIRDVASRILSLIGCDVTCAENGEKAVDLYRAAKEEKPFDICILDLVVPGGMSGKECAQEILKIDQNALLLVSSGYSDDPVLSHFRDYGFRGVIPKPYTLAELHRALSDVLVL